MHKGPIELHEGGSRWIVQSRNVDAGFLALSAKDLVRIKPEAAKRDVLLLRNDLLFMSRGVKNYTVLLQDVPNDSLAAASFFIVRPDLESVDPLYLTWLLNHPISQQYFTQFGGSGVHMPVVKRVVLEQLKVPLPSLDKQRKIGSLYQLMFEEQSLMKSLTQNRKKLLDAACLKIANSE